MLYYITKLWDWKANRNEARAKLESEYGYDTKHASHLVRLMLVCQEILTTGNYNPKLEGDILQLVKDTRAGKFDYNWIIDFSIEMDKSLNELYKISNIPNKANIKEINNILLDILKG